MFNFIKQFHQTYTKEQTTPVQQEPNDTDSDLPTGKLKTLRVKIMVSTLLNPSAMSHLYEIRRLTTAISDQVSYLRFAKWKDTEPVQDGRPLWAQIPNSPQDAEQFIDGFHGSINQPKGYYRLHILYPEDIALETFQSVFAQINIPQKQSIALAPEKVLFPSKVGFIKGSTEAMIHSADFNAILATSQLAFGLDWKYIQTGKNGKFDRNQKAIYIEANAADVPKMKSFLSTFFANNNPIFGVNLGFQPISQYGTNIQLNQIKIYAPTQSKLVSSLLDLDVEIGNFETITAYNETTKESEKLPLVEALLHLTSITQKKSIRKGNEFHFDGKVFYSAITNAATNITTFQFFDYNENEAKGILRGLPLFLQDYFKVPAEKINSYCRSSHIVEAKNGTWDSTTRTFYSKEETAEMELFENLQILTNATTVEVPQYIDPDHHRMMTGQTLDEMSEQTNLHVQADDNSSLTPNTGSTHTSKAKKYADSVRKEMIKEMQLQKKESDKEIERLRRLITSAKIDDSPSHNEDSDEDSDFDDDVTIQTNNGTQENREEPSLPDKAYQKDESTTQTINVNGDDVQDDEYEDESDEYDNGVASRGNNANAAQYPDEGNEAIDNVTGYSTRSKSPNKRKKPLSPSAKSPQKKLVVHELDSGDELL